jgi:hypothetical protein
MPAMPQDPRLTDAKRAEQGARAERLARALRDNLRRRKEQVRERDMAAGNGVSGNPKPGQRKRPA